MLKFYLHKVEQPCEKDLASQVLIPLFSGHTLYTRVRCGKGLCRLLCARTELSDAEEDNMWPGAKHLKLLPMA